MWSVGQADTQRRGEPLTKAGVKKCLLVATGSLPMSLTLTEEEAWPRGHKEWSERSKDHDKLGFKHIQILVPMLPPV